MVCWLFITINNFHSETEHTDVVSNDETDKVSDAVNNKVFWVSKRITINYSDSTFILYFLLLVCIKPRRWSVE